MYVLPVGFPTNIGIATVTDELGYDFWHGICSSAWYNLHNIGWRCFSQLKSTTKKMEIKKPKNVGNNNRQKPVLSTLASVQAKLTQAKIKLACMFAIKTAAGVSGGVMFCGASGNEEDDIVYLTSNTTNPDF